MLEERLARVPRRWVPGAMGWHRATALGSAPGALCQCGDEGDVTCRHRDGGTQVLGPAAAWAPAPRHKHLCAAARGSARHCCFRQGPSAKHHRAQPRRWEPSRLRSGKTCPCASACTIPTLAPSCSCLSVGIKLRASAPLAEGCTARRRPPALAAALKHERTDVYAL